MTFSSWLLKQDGRDDPVGDLARDYRNDKRCHRKGLWWAQLPTGSSWRAWRKYLEGKAAEDALREAYDEWTQISKPADQRFINDPEHGDRPGTPKCIPCELPETLLEFLRALPESVVKQTCSSIGHPSLFLGPGYRYKCICDDYWYHD